jgi:hypothetical protein
MTHESNDLGKVKHIELINVLDYIKVKKVENISRKGVKLDGLFVQCHDSEEGPIRIKFVHLRLKSIHYILKAIYFSSAHHKRKENFRKLSGAECLCSGLDSCTDSLPKSFIS